MRSNRILLALFALLLGACGQSTPESAPSSSSAPAPVAAAPAADAAPAQAAASAADAVAAADAAVAAKPEENTAKAPVRRADVRELPADGARKALEQRQPTVASAGTTPTALADLQGQEGTKIGLIHTANVMGEVDPCG